MDEANRERAVDTPPPRVSIAARLLTAGVLLYQATLRPVMGGHCRFQPTCSDYALEALRQHGAWRGGRLAARRLFRCHPLGGGGYDPVPPRAEVPEPEP
ncbi:MAG: membrane protein insertion efficiency factor YidD [Planctomycetes bacterium]|nr:membrane protein insertion efficiency factor YidD [Planctomycetota bacterium]